MRRGPDIQTSRPDRATRTWSRLAMVWALYYLVTFTLGSIPAYMQRTIWMGAGIVGLFTVPVFWRHIRLRSIPREGRLLVLFSLWAMGGRYWATDQAMFQLFMKLVLELTVVVIAVAVIVGRSGSMHWFYLAYWGVAIFRVVYGEGAISMERIADTRAVERITDANAVGYYCSLGIVGMLALLKEVKRMWMKGLLIAGGAFALYGVVLSASRGAFVALMAIAVLWPLLCMVGSSRYKLNALVVAAILIFLAFQAVQLIIQETYLGVRFTQASQLEDGSSQTRLDLFLSGLRIFMDNPITGCGLGQFGVASGTGFYAHNEFAEILATTGLPGLFLYFPIYWQVWRRLTWSLRYLHDPLVRYRINMARMIMLVLLISGFLSRPNFISQDTMFLLGIVVGVSYWAERSLQKAQHTESVANPAFAATGWPPPTSKPWIRPTGATPGMASPPIGGAGFGFST